MRTFNFTETKNLVRKYLSSQEKPPFILTLISSPGMGKTSLVKSVCEELGLTLVTIPCSSITRQTFSLSFIVENNLTTLTLDALKDKNTVLFLEELDRTPTSTLPVLLPILAGRRIGNDPVHCHILATANFPKKLSALDPALPSRLIFVHLKTEIQEIFAYLTEKYGVNLNDIAERTLVALRLTSEQYHPETEKYNPRQIENILSSILTFSPSTIDEVLSIVQSNLPDDIYQTFANYLLYSDIPAPTDRKILEFVKAKNPTGKHFFAVRQLVLHLATCQQGNCTHPTIEEVIKSIMDASPTLIDAFTTSIFDLPTANRVPFVATITSYKPQNQQEKQKIEHLKDMISAIMTTIHKTQR